MNAETPTLAGIHHLKLPVTDLVRSLQWYRSRLGYQVQIEFVEHGILMGYALAHPAGGPGLALRFDPDRARAAAGFDYFAIGVPDKAAMDRLASALDAMGQAHAGVHRASMGWILPEVRDPDGHVLRFYTLEHHTDAPSGQVTTFRDPRETAERIERESAGRQPSAAEHPAAGHPAAGHPAARLRPARAVTRSAGTAPPPGQPRPR
jgi:catechol 2,3-dioxygenase-like lactoylglutathione lyase family enzyme